MFYAIKIPPALLILSACAIGAPAAAEDSGFPREEPLRGMDTPRVLHAKEFGVIPDDGKCDADAIQKALDALSKLRNAKLVFEKGVYYVSLSPRGSERAFVVEGAKDIAIDARGSEFIISSPFLGLWTFVGCGNVIIENMSVDYDPLPQTCGRVVKIDEAGLSMDVEVLPKHPDFDAAHLQTSGTGFFMDGKIAGRQKRGMRPGYTAQSFENIGKSVAGNAVFKIKFGELPEISLLKEGDVFTRTCKRSAAVFGGHHNRQITFRNIEIFAGPAGAFTLGFSEAMNFLNCKNTIRQGRWKSTNADAFHIPNNRVGPWIEDCRVEGIADDCINIYLVPTFPVEQVDARTLRIVPKGSRTDKPLDENEFRNGDEVFFFSPKTQSIFASARVKSADYKTGIVKFDRDLDGVSCGLDKHNSTTIYNAENSNGIVIRKSEFKNSKRFGAYVKGKNVLIEDCVFEGLSSSAIVLMNEPGWPEGLFSRNVVIRRNIFIDNGFDEHYEFGWPGGAITSLAPGCKIKSGYYMNSDILIEENTFRLWRGRAIYMRETECCEILNNTFLEPAAPSGIRARDNDAAIALEKSRAIKIEGNANRSGVEEVFKKNCGE